MINTVSFFPEALIRLPIWVLWRLEERKGKVTKVPYQINGRRASSTNPATWATHRDAVAAWQENPDQFDGIGTVMSKQYRTVFIDIDHCIHDGSFDDRAKDILSAFMDDDGNLTTFTEVSQSGTGLHLIVIGEIPGAFHNQKQNVEMYDSGRYIAMTGKAFSACEPSECADGLRYVYKRYKPASTAPESASHPVADSSESHTDDWIISHASDREGQKFSTLFKGDWSRYPSQSEADLALCKIIAFWADNNPEQIDRIFRQSGMYRAKWDREDYSTMTIQKAIDTNDDTLSAFTQRKIKERSFQSLESLPQSVIDKTYVENRLKAIDPANDPKYNTADDIASAQLFKAVFERYVRYNATAKSWYVYDGIRWKPDLGGLAVESYAKMFSRALLIYSADVPSKDFRKHIYAIQERRKRETIIKDARDLLPVHQGDFDTDPYLFNCQNGILNLKTFEFTDHDPGLLLSKVANVVYDPNARCDVFDTFMDQIMQGDQAKIENLQTLFGYAMTGKNEREECFMLYGSTTRNGKGTLTNTIRYLFGDYGANIQPETLAMQKNRDGRTPSGDIARLNGVRFLQMSEPPKRMMIDVALLKTMIGRDVITARYLYEREFEFTPCFKLFINTNFLPVVLDDTLFSSGRVKVITFDRHFDKAEQDHTLKDRLQTQESLSGILNWLLEGLKRYNANHGIIAVPESVQKATDDYRLKSDKIQSFIDEVLTPDKGSAIMAKSIYTAFVDWCRSNGYYPESKKNFLSELKAKGLLFSTGTINGKTQHNVVKGYKIEDYVIGSGGI